MRALDAVLRRRRVSPAQVAFLSGYSFPPALREKVAEELPTLGRIEVDRVLEGLRVWFLVCLHARGKRVGMPSRAVDVAWHEFILLTREYTSFCEQAFGYYLHHSPASTLNEPLSGSLRRTLRIVDDLPATAIPVAGGLLLFTIDGELGLADGYLYTADTLQQLRRGDGSGGSGGGCSAGDSGGGDGGGCGGGCGSG